MSETLDTKIRAGRFWGKDGAIADTRKIAVLSLSQPDSNIIDALSMMINIHTQASEYALKHSDESYKFLTMRKHHRELYNKSKRALWRYNMMWRLCMFFVYL
ncbi:MAG: hypothetical protein HYT94_00920 [Parcubacteria group bacterium]|nr:hypothetical protein [Parcubacteria group bacterium]